MHNSLSCPFNTYLTKVQWKKIILLEWPFAKECLILERRKCSALLSRKQCLLCLIVTGCSLAADVLMKLDQLPIGCSCPYLCCCWCLSCLGITSCGVDQVTKLGWPSPVCPFCPFSDCFCHLKSNPIRTSFCNSPHLHLQFMKTMTWTLRKGGIAESQ